MTTFTESHDLAPPRMVLTTRTVAWATSALSWDDTTVSALARQLGVDWHTCWDAVEVEARARTSDPARLPNVKTLGVDEHIVRHEALLFRMEVRDLRRSAVVAVG
jgi:transposase